MARSRGPLAKEEILREFLDRCQLKGIERITLTRLSREGTPGGTQLDAFELGEILTGLEEDTESFIDQIVQRCHQETDGHGNTSSFKLYAYHEKEERHAFCTPPLVVQVHQDALEGGNFEGSSTIGGIVKTLTSHIERREYQSTQLLELAVRLATRSIESSDRRARAYEEKGMAVFELEQTLLDRRQERELEAKKAAISEERTEAIVRQLLPHIPGVVQHLASAATGGKLPAPVAHETSEEGAEQEEEVSPRTRFLAWVTKYPDASDKLVAIVGEDEVAELLEIATTQDGGELRGAVMLWMSEHDVTRKTLAEIAGAGGRDEFYAILKGE